MALLKVSDLSLGFAVGGQGGGTVHTAVDRISFSVEAGETFALLGESGCGKSATALALLRLLPPAGRILGGRVELAGAAAGSDKELLGLSEAAMREVRGGELAMIFQEPATSLNPVLTVGFQIIEVLNRHRQLHGAAARREAEALLQQVGIADPQRRLDEYPFQMSGGMKQRVMIAIALAGNPRLLVADEPTTALDVTIQAQILDLLAQLQAERGMGMLLITHDLGVVARSADRVGVMYAGEIIEEASRDDFFRAPAHPYAQQLFAALPDLDSRGAPLATLPGRVPPLGEWPVGCRFAPRCPQAFARCSQEAPAWHSVGDSGHRARCHLLDPASDHLVTVSQPGKAVAVPASVPLHREPLLTVSELAMHFPIRKGLLQRTVGQVKAVDGVSLRLLPGRTLALVGESGCGKTTVGKAILQLLRPTGGSVRLGEQELIGLSAAQLRPLRRRMQMVFQDPFGSLNPRLSVGEIISEGIAALGVDSGGSGGQDKKAARAAAVARLLEQVGLGPEAADRYPHEFSGGQRQRIAIARALAVQPEVLICDEPTSALDVSVQAQILNLLKSLQDQLGLSYLFITHNFAVVEYLADEVAVMYLGRIVERGNADEVLRSPRHPYTRALLAAVPSPRLRDEATPANLRLPGETPSPAAPPAGCHFHPRCPLAAEQCRQSYPPAVQVSATQVVHCYFAQ